MVNEPPPSQRFWIAVESYKNWLTDSDNAFQFTGVSSSRERRAAQARNGDLIFVYVPSPRCSFSDVRRVAKNGLSRSPHTRLYDMPCSGGLVTTPERTLEVKKWVPVQQFIGKLSFIKISFKWGQAFRVSFREITPKDAVHLITAMQLASPELEWGSIMKEAVAVMKKRS